MFASLADGGDDFGELGQVEPLVLILIKVKTVAIDKNKPKKRKGS